MLILTASVRAVEEEEEEEEKIFSKRSGEWRERREEGFKV